MTMTCCLIYTDLDGTLLDHQDYSYNAALPTLEKIQRLNFPLILNSSKTLAEITTLRQQLNNHHPFIVENGAAIYIPQHYFPGYTQPLNCELLAGNRKDFLPIIHELRTQYKFLFRGFADFSLQEIMDFTGLDQTQAKNAAQRIGSEPIIWQDNNRQLELFTAKLAAAQLRLVKGGRFFHIMGQTDKGRAMQWLSDRYRQFQPADWCQIALGDSNNDLSMLESADISAVIKNHRGSHLQLAKAPGEVIYTEQQAPAGWQEAMDQVFRRLNIA